MRNVAANPTSGGYIFLSDVWNTDPQGASQVPISKMMFGALGADYTVVADADAARLPVEPTGPSVAPTALDDFTDGTIGNWTQVSLGASPRFFEIGNPAPAAPDNAVPNLLIQLGGDPTAMPAVAGTVIPIPPGKSYGWIGALRLSGPIWISSDTDVSVPYWGWES